MKYNFLLRVGIIFLFVSTAFTPLHAQALGELQSLLDQARSQLSSLFQQKGIDFSFTSSDSSTSTDKELPNILFTHDLEANDEGEDVKLLQQLLNRDFDTQLAITGLGSPGNETNFFGRLTYQAVLKFQTKYKDEILTPLGLFSPTGYVGFSTIKKLRSLYGFIGAQTDNENQEDEETDNSNHSENGDEDASEDSSGSDNELEAPSPVRMSVSYNSVSLSWGSVEKADYYRVKRSVNQSDYSILADNLSSAFYNDRDIEENRTYYYYIVGVKNNQEGDKSVIMKADIPRRSGGGGGSEEENATLPFSGMTVNSDGWTASTTIGSSVDGGTYVGLNSTSSPGLALTVTSTSWNTSGVQTTKTRTVYATAIKRKAYPNQTTLLEIENGTDLDVIFTLSEEIYSSDTVTASVLSGFFTDDGAGGSSLSNSAQTPTVTNSSTLSYPEPQAVWLMHDLQNATTTTFSPKLLVMHRFAQQGQPVRAVKFTATDESAGSVSAIATALSREQYSASGLYSNYFTADLDFSSLTVGDLVTVDAVIYPWVGDSFTISTGAESYPSPNLTTLKVLNDNDGSVGTVYAYVDGVGGGTPAVHETASVASTTPYATIHAAASAIQTYNNTNFSRNNVSGGIVRISEGTTITGFGTDTMDALTDGDIPLVIEGANQTTSIYTNEATSVNNDINNYLKFKNLTIQKNGGSVIAFDGKASDASNILIFEDVIFDANAQSSYAAWAYRFGRGYFVNSSGDNFQQGEPFSTAAQGTALALGNNFIPARLYNAVANDVTDTDITHGVSPALENLSGMVYAFNFLKNSSASSKTVNIEDISFGTRGVAIIGNILEKYHTSATPPNLSLSADGDVTANQNLIEAMNTVVGERTNILYQDTGTVTVSKRGISKHSIHKEWNSKSDVFGTNSNLTGNWSFRYKVGGGYNFIDLGDSSGNTTPGAANWLGEILGAGDVVTGNPMFTNDQSADGGGAGNGDYSLGASTDVPQIPGTETMFGWDLYGTAIPTDGSARAGAIQ